MKNSLTIEEKGTTLLCRAEQSRAEQSRAEQSRAGGRRFRANHRHYWRCPPLGSNLVLRLSSFPVYQIPNALAREKESGVWRVEMKETGDQRPDNVNRQTSDNRTHAHFRANFSLPLEGVRKPCLVRKGTACGV